MGNLWMLLDQTLAVLGVALFLLAIKFFFRDKLSPKWQYSIWGLLAMRIALPVGLGARDIPFSGRWLVSNLRVATELNLSSAYSSAWIQTDPMFSLPLLPNVMPTSTTDWLFVGYLAWVLVSALWFIGKYLRLRRSVGMAVPVCGDVLTATHEIASRYNLPTPKKIVESRHATTPFVIGIFSPTLVIPMGAMPQESVVLHELLHLKYYDVLGGWVTTMARCLHPALWLICDRIDNERECACDQRVLELLSGEDRRAYGKLLLSMVDDSALRVPGATTMANGGSNIKTRIKAVVKFRKFPQGMELVSLCMALMLGSSLLMGTSRAVETADSAHPLPTESVALSFAQRNPATTAAGALDFYAASVYNRLTSRNSSLSYAAVYTPTEDIPALVEQWETYYDDNYSRSYSRSFESGPIIRNLSSDGEGSYLVELWMFRDSAPSLDDLPHGVMAQIHFLRLMEDENGIWTIVPLSIDEQWFSGEYIDFQYYPTTVVWTGTLEGLDVELSYTGEVNVRGASLNGSPYELYSALYRDIPYSFDPDPDAQFSRYLHHYNITITNRTDAPMDFTMRVDGADDSTSKEILGEDFSALAPQESVASQSCGHGATWVNRIEWNEVRPYDTFSLTAVVDGEETIIELTQEVRLP